MKTNSNLTPKTSTAQKMKFSMKDFFSKCGQIHWKLRIWSHLQKKSLMEDFIFCAVVVTLLIDFANFLISFDVNYHSVIILVVRYT